MSFSALFLCLPSLISYFHSKPTFLKCNFIPLKLASFEYISCLWTERLFLYNFTSLFVSAQRVGWQNEYKVKGTVRESSCFGLNLHIIGTVLFYTNLSTWANFTLVSQDTWHFENFYRFLNIYDTKQHQT